MPWPPSIVATPPPPAGDLIHQHHWPTAPATRSDLTSTLVELVLRHGWVSTVDETWLRLCMDEAVINALYHGNEGDPTLGVTSSLWCDGLRWTLWLTDEGLGFTAADIPGFDQPDDLLREHGRGLKLMSEWLDELTFHDGGRTARLVRRRDPAICHSLNQ
jgi:serine/threonine-protein kinase RsbW